MNPSMHSPRIPPWLRLLPDRLLVAVLFCFGPLVYLMPLSAVALLFVIFVMTAGLAALSTGLQLRAAFRSLIPFLPLFAWMFLSILWALDRPAALSLAIRLGILFVAGGLLTWWFATIPLDRLRLPVLALVAGLVLAALFLTLDLHFGGAMVRHLHRPQPASFDIAVFYNRGATIHAILLVPLAVFLLRLGSPWLAAAHALIGIVAILATASLSAKTALGGALIATAAIRLLPRLRWALLGLLALGAAALPFIFPITLDPVTSCWLNNHKASALHRLFIWDFAAERIDEHPFIGWGLDAARRMPGGDTPLIIRHCDRNLQQTGNLAVESTLLPLHPHSAILQIWLELGGIGAVLGFGMLITLLARAYGATAWRNPTTQAAFGASTLAGLSVALVSFGIWQEWFLAALFTAAAIAVFAARTGEVQPPNK
jgi:exopolysaccharide production protein ExoQ